MFDMTTSTDTPPATSASGRKRPSAPPASDTGPRGLPHELMALCEPARGDVDEVELEADASPREAALEPRSRHALSSSIAACRCPCRSRGRGSSRPSAAQSRFHRAIVCQTSRPRGRAHSAGGGCRRGGRGSGAGRGLLEIGPGLGSRYPPAASSESLARRSSFASPAAVETDGDERRCADSAFRRGRWRRPALGQHRGTRAGRPDTASSSPVGVEGDPVQRAEISSDDFGAAQWASSTTIPCRATCCAQRREMRREVALDRVAEIAAPASSM